MRKNWIILVVALILPWGCSRNPVTGKRELSLMSESQEVALGQQSDPSIVAQFGLYQDQQLQTFINAKGQEMAKVSHRDHLKYEFKVLDSPVVNAFALPGGYVYFTRGIMAHFNNEAEFAGVLGHEIGHITARHGVQQQTKAMLGQLGLIAGIIIKPEFAQYMNIASQGMQLLFMKFSRDDESQSDELGVEYSTKIGYDAHEMAGFFQTLDRLSGGAENRIPTFMSTHPDPLNREQNVAQLANEWQSELGKSRGALKVNRDSYLKMIEGLIYGEDPRQGYVQNSKFYHPELRFEYPIPSGWQTNNTPIQVQMQPKDGKALMVLRLSQEKTPQAAAQRAAQELKMTPIESNSRNINGLQAVVTTSDQQVDPNTPPEQQNPVRIRSGYILLDGRVYELHGLSSAADFANYLRSFDATISGFKKLTDASKINVKPERLSIKTVPNNTTLQAFLKQNGIPQARLKEFSIVNGMELNQGLKKGDLIKVVTTNS